MQLAAPQVSAPPQPPQRERRKSRSPRAKQMPCLLQPIDLEIGLQQGELDQVVLRSAAANALAFPGQWGKHLDRRGEIPALYAVKRDIPGKYEPDG